MTDEELRKLAERLDAATIDWYGTRMLDTAEAIYAPLCRTLRAASSAILSLMDRATLAETRLARAVEALTDIANAENPFGPDLVRDFARTVLSELERSLPQEPGE